LGRVAGRGEEIPALGGFEESVVRGEGEVEGAFGLGMSRVLFDDDDASVRKHRFEMLLGGRGVASNRVLQSVEKEVPVYVAYMSVLLNTGIPR